MACRWAGALSRAPRNAALFTGRRSLLMFEPREMVIQQRIRQ